MDKMDAVKSHFESEADIFDDLIIKLIPFYKEMIKSLILAIPFERTEGIKVIDLGCGTGTISKLVKEAFPNARITCLDLAESMIETAKIKLNDYGDNITYMVGDFQSFNFPEKYDVIVSSLALHHLVTDEDKKQFYVKIYEGLSNRGVFYNADVVHGSTEYLNNVYMQKWKEYMNKSISMEEIENKWIATHRIEDSPAQTFKHIKWLEEIGFNKIDIIWKYYNFTVYGGSR